MAFALKTTGSKAVRAQTARKSVVVKALAPTTKVSGDKDGFICSIDQMGLMPDLCRPISSQYDEELIKTAVSPWA